MKSAKEYWKERFGEYPQNDADRLAIVMMMEYYNDARKDKKEISSPVISYDLPKDYDDWKKNGNGQRTKIQLGVLALWEILLYDESNSSLFVACDHLEDIVRVSGLLI